MVTQFGMSENIGTIYLGSDQEVFVGMEFGQSREYSEEIAAKIDREVSAMLEKCYKVAKDILTEKKDRLDLLVEALLQQETLNRAEFLAVMDEGVLPEGLGDDKPRTTKEVLEAAARERGETPEAYGTAETAEPEAPEAPAEPEEAETPDEPETVQAAEEHRDI